MTKKSKGTKKMKNNNQAVVRKITGRALRFDKRRNFFVVAAILLTAFMIASGYHGITKSTLVERLREAE
jgi:hypothetical protein